jgi:multidrug efflux pump subunit AcrB
LNLAEAAIRNFRFTIVVFLMMVAIGASAFHGIARTEDPYFPYPGFRIIGVYPGADALEIERQLVKPIEDRLNELDDVKEMVSTSDDSLGLIQVEFNATVDVERKYDEVTREIAALAGTLPKGVTSLEVKKINPGRVNIVQFALVSESASYRQLADLAKDLQDVLKAIPAVRTAETWAYPRRELRIALNPRSLAERNLHVGQVLATVRARNANIPGGPVEAGARRFNLQTTGAYQGLDQVRNTIVAASGERLVRIGDIADVGWDYQSEESSARLNGRRAVWITASQKDAQNIFTTGKAIDAAVQDFEKTLPAGISLVRCFDQSRNVDHRLSRLGEDFALAIALVAITLLPLGLRAAGVVMVSIPLSLVLGLAALYFSGFSLNQLSIAGFVVALGLLVDDSIVVTENIARYLRMGHSRTQAAILATGQIAQAVLGCTAALVFAFLPMLLLPGTPGIFIRSLPVAVVFTVLASLLVALAVIPFLASRMLGTHEAPEGNAVLRALMRTIHRSYAPLLARCLAAPRRVVLLSTLLFVASLGLLPIVGFSLFPKAGIPQFLVQVTLPDGASLARTDEVLHQVEVEVARLSDVRYVMSNLGRGNPQVYYNVTQHEYSAHYAEVLVNLGHFDEWRTPAELDRLRERLDAIAGAEIVVKEFQNGPFIPAPITIRVLGRELEPLRALAAEVEDIVRATPGARDVMNAQRRSRMDLKLDLDAQRAGLLGVDPAEFGQAVRLAVSGIPAGDFREPNGEVYPVVLRAPMARRASLQTLDDFHLGNARGGQVPLAELAQLRLIEAPAAISRYNRERAVLITAYPRTGFNTIRVTGRVVDGLDQLHFPPGYHVSVGGDMQSTQESLGGLGTAMLITTFSILAVLVLEFGSFKSMLIVLGVIPLGVTGGVVALFLTGNSLSFTAGIGFIALVGIEIKNSILLVDFTNQLRAQGKPLDAAIAEAGEVRFLPILLTSLTAVGGLLPLALQNSGLYSPLAWVVIGGLVSSTLLGRLVTPVMYKLLPPAVAAAAPDDPP